jgi:Alpha galactosidase A/Alpha galactosidase C-terminal beta sandwich domain
MLAALMGFGSVVFVLAGAPVAQAKPRGVDPQPVMGWSSWSFLRFGLNTADIEQEAQALVTSGLASVGYKYINLDDGWYQCPGSQGPNVDQYGRWVIDSAAFPGVGSQNGIQALAAYVHSLGLKFGIYETAGISDQAVTANTPILGTSHTAGQIASTNAQNNYNCGGMVGLNYAAPGAQKYVNSVVDELGSWGVDYIKLDGVTNSNVPDIMAWSAAIKHSGRPMVLDTTQGSFTVEIARKLKRYANQWEFAPDIEINGPHEASNCYNPPFSGCSNVFPLTSYSHWSDRFNDVATWKPYGGPGGFNDYDSIEVGNGPANSGMSLAAEESQLSLWALGSSPLILGSDLTSSVTNAFGSNSGIDPNDLSLLMNRQVIAVDQDSKDALRISNLGTTQVFAKKERGGDGIVGMFDTNTDVTAANDTISTTTSAMGLRRDRAGYSVLDLWTGQSSTIPSTGEIIASVPSEGVALYRVTPR